MSSATASLLGNTNLLLLLSVESTVASQTVAQNLEQVLKLWPIKAVELNE